MCCKPKCKNPNYAPWYLCRECLNAWIVYVIACEPEDEAKAKDFAPAIIKPIKGGGGGHEIEQPKSWAQVVASAVGIGR